MPVPKKIARLRLVDHVGRPMVGVKTPYDPQLVTAFKSGISYGDRSWDAQVKGWFFSPANHVQASLRGLLQACGYDVLEDPNIFPELADPGAASFGTPNIGGRVKRPAKAAAAPTSGAAAEDDRFYARKYATADDYAVLYLLEGAPLPVAKAAYRALMGMSHPDAGGMQVDAQRVNVAWQRIEKQLSEDS